MAFALSIKEDGKLQYTSIDAETLAKMFLAGARRLDAKKEYINELNVFPVPDGDTGTNMNLTIVSAVNEVNCLTEMNMATVSKAISSGSLRGARGNSGVILSQLFRGFSKIVKEKSELDVLTLSMAATKATETAYKAVMKPKEGTILTVAKACSDKANELANDSVDVAEFFKMVIEAGDAMLLKTPEMLPVLKEAGVVDSGGQGLMEVLHGAYAYLIGEETLGDEESSEEETKEAKPIVYSAEFLLNVKGIVNKEKVSSIYDAIKECGEEVICKEDDNSVRVHIHSEDPGMALSSILPFGTLEVCKIEIAKEGHRHKIFMADDFENIEIPEIIVERSEKKEESVDSVAKKQDNAKNKEEAAEKPEVVKKAPSKEMGFIAVSVGDGMDAIFKGLGVDYLISGGQTMNPSTDDMLKAIDNVDAKTVFILPNNKNIILAANQAQYLVEDKNVIVIPTKTAPQGITALINYMPDNSPEDNAAIMNEEISKVKTGQVTYAVRDTVISGVNIVKGNIMGIGDHDILSVGEIISDTTLEMVDRMIDEESELISIYYGEEIEEEDANELLSLVEEKYPDCDVELHPGGQPIYYYIVSVE